MAYIWSYCMDFFQFLVVASPGPRSFFNDLNGCVTNMFWFFVNMGPYGSVILLLQITAESFQTFLVFFSQCSSQKCIWDFWNLENRYLNAFYSFSLTWDPMGVKNSKRYSYKSQPKLMKLVLNFPPNGPHKIAFGVFEILSFRFFSNLLSSQL